VCTTFVDVVYICRHADFSSESDDAAATPAASAAEASRENSTQPPAEVRKKRNRCLDMFLSFAMSGSVCLIMLYIACISKTTCRNLPDFLCLLSMAMFSSEHNAVRCVLLVFTARCYASAVLAMGLCLSVRLSVCLCLSQVGVLLKRLNVGSQKQQHTIAQGL